MPYCKTMHDARKEMIKSNKPFFLNASHIDGEVMLAQARIMMFGSTGKQFRCLEKEIQ